MSSPSIRIVEMDRLPLPVEISFIRLKVLEGESLRIGNKSFSQVMSVGCISSYRYVRSLSSMEYVMIDPSADAAVPKEISVIHREECTNDIHSTDLKESERFPLGTHAFIIGKLIRFKGSVAIQAYFLRELICSEEYECLKMEAFLALQYHTKNPSGQTPVRQPQGSSNLRKSFPLSTPSSSAPEKRPSSVNTLYTPPSKRSTLRNIKSSTTTREPVSSKSEMSGAFKQCCTVKEAGSQDSFEDNVLYF